MSEYIGLKPQILTNLFYYENYQIDFHPIKLTDLIIYPNLISQSTITYFFSFDLLVMIKKLAYENLNLEFVDNFQLDDLE